MRTFKLVRYEEDASIVACGAVFDNGRVAMQWQVEDMPESLIWYTCIEDMEKVHLHGGKTVVVYDIDGINREKFLDALDRIENLVGFLYRIIG